MSSRSLGVCLLALVACQDDITQTVVVIDGDERVRSQIERLELVVEGGPSDPPFVAITEQTRVLPSSGLELTLPAQQPVQPLDGDASRLFRATVTARLGPDERVAGRVITGYSRGQSLVARIFLTAECVNVTCDQDETCERGACVSAVTPTEELPPYQPMELGTEPGDAATVAPGDAASVDMSSPTCMEEPTLLHPGAVETLSVAEGTLGLRLAWSEGGAVRTALIEGSGLGAPTELRTIAGGNIAVSSERPDGSFLLVHDGGPDTMSTQRYDASATPVGDATTLTDAVILAISPLVSRTDGWLLMVQDTAGMPVVIDLDATGAERGRSSIGPTDTTWYRLRDTLGGLVATWRHPGTRDCVAVLLNADGTRPPSPRIVTSSGCFDPDIASNGSGFGFVSHRRAGDNRDVRLLPLEDDLTQSTSGITVSSSSFAQNQGAHVSWTGSAYRPVWTSDTTGFSWALLDAAGSSLEPPRASVGIGTVGNIVSLSEAVFFLRVAGADEGIYWLQDCPP